MSVYKLGPVELRCTLPAARAGQASLVRSIATRLGPFFQSTGSKLIKLGLEE